MTIKRKISAFWRFCSIGSEIQGIALDYERPVASAKEVALRAQSRFQARRYS